MYETSVQQTEQIICSAYSVISSPVGQSPHANGSITVKTITKDKDITVIYSIVSSRFEATLLPFHAKLLQIADRHRQASSYRSKTFRNLRLIMPNYEAAPNRCRNVYCADQPRSDSKNSKNFKHLIAVEDFAPRKTLV